LATATLKCQAALASAWSDAESTIEFPTDTTRTIASLLLSGGPRALFRHPLHFFPRGQNFGLNYEPDYRRGMKPEERMVKLPKGPEHELQRQYYEVASIGLNPAGIAALRILFPTSQLLYGSDEPFLSSAQLGSSLRKQGFSTADLQAMQRGNAVRLQWPHESPESLFGDILKPFSTASVNSGSRGALFDHLIGLREERRRNRHAERFCCLQIDHELELGGLNDR